MSAPRALEISRRNPLAFPAGRAPGFDPTHPASSGISGIHGVSAIASGGNSFINLINGTISAVHIATGAGGLAIDSYIGPASVSTANNLSLDFTIAEKTDTVGTLAAIFVAGTQSLPPSAIVSFGGDNGGASATLALSSGLAVVLYYNGSTLVATSSFTVSANVPYAVFASYQNAGTINLVLINLLNGSIQSYSTTTASTFSTSGDGTFCIGNAQAFTGNGLIGRISSVMYAPCYLSLNQLLAWAADPWAFWYPRQSRAIFKSAAAVTSFLMSVGAGYYSLTDEQETLLKASKATIYDGTYTLTDESLQTLKGSKSSVYTGYYSLTDEQLTLLKASKQYPQAGYYSLTGEQVTETAARKATVQTGYYSLTVEQLALLFGHKATVQTGYYSLTEEQLTLLNAHSQTIQTGYYSVIGEQLTLTFSGATGFVMAIGAGTYSLSGENQGQVKKSIAALSTTFYTLTEENLQTLKGSKIGAQTGYYTFTVENEKLLYGREATIQSGSYTLTGEQITEIAAHFSKLGAGVYSMTGEAVITIAGLRVIIKAAPILLGADITPNLVGNESPTDLLGADIVPGLKGQVT